VNAFAAPIERLRAPELSIPRTALGLAGLLLVSLLLRDTALHARYWIDEGLSVGIASHPLTAIPSVLREDGSPPLYYMLLGLWTSLVGDGEARTHALSLGFALLTVPVGFFAGCKLFDERTGWFVAVLAALNPFLNYYSQETRMYALVVLLSLLVITTFALAYVHGRRRWLAGFVLSGTALLYTHNWGLFTLAGTAVALLPLLRSKAVSWRDVLIGYGTIAVLYLPWLPTFLFQAHHTGAPWSHAPSVNKLPGDLAALAGGPGPAVAILLVGGSGLATYLATGEAAGRRSRQTTTVMAVGVTILCAILLAFVASQIAPAWTMRYFAAIVGPFVVLVGVLLARSGTLGLVTLALLAGLWLHPPTARINNKSNVHHVAAVVSPWLQPGDIVVSTHPEQVPVLHFYFPHGLRWANGMGWVKDTTYMDWRDALTRYKTARPTPTADLLVRALKPGQQLALVQPVLRTANWKAPWTSLIRRRAHQWERVLGRDHRLLREAGLPRLRGKPLPRGVRVVLYRRVG
jgi:mannosyltransferase